MTPRRKFLFGLMTVPTALAAYASYDWYLSRNVLLSEIPRRTVGTLSLADRDTVMNVRADVPLELLRAAVRQTLPQEYAFGGHGSDACVDLGLLGKHCAGTRYEGVVRRNGDFTVSGTGNTITVAVPIKIEGNGGLRGDGAKLVKLDAKNFRAALVLKATVTLDLNADWTPAVTVVPDLTWTERPEVEIVHKVWVDVRGHVEGKMRDKLDEMAQKLRETIPADIVRREVAKAWHVHTLPIPGTGTTPAFAHVTPTVIGFTGITIQDDQIRAGIMLKARTELSTNATPAGALVPMPQLSRVQPAAGKLAVAVPVRANYDVLRTALKQDVGGKTFSTTIAGKQTSVIVKDVNVYPAGDKLVFGIDFIANAPGRLFDTWGQVYLTAKPVTDKGGTLIRMTDVAFARRLDNTLWSAASVIFEDQIKGLITTKAQVDLSSTINKAVADLKEKIADPSKTGGVRITIREASAGIEQIATEALNLAALVRIDVGIDTTLQQIAPLKQAAIPPAR